MKTVMFLSAALSLFAASGVAADTYIKSEIESSGFAGIGGMKGETEMWISGTKSVEKTKFNVKSPLLKLFMSGSKTHAITNLEDRMRVDIERKEKQYQEVSLDDIRAEIEGAKQTVRDGYENATSDAPHHPPWTDVGMQKTRIDVTTFDESEKFAGIATTRSQFKMFSDAVDESSGETVTFKITYDAWMADEIPGQDELHAYHRAYSDALGVSFDDGDVSLAGALAIAGIDMSQFEESRGKMSGYPMKVTVRVGSVLTDIQRADLTKLELEAASKKKKGGFGGLKIDLAGGMDGVADQVKQHAEDAVTDKIATTLTDKLAQSLFGEGVASDEDGDLVFFTTTTEVKKIETKSLDDDVFEVPEGYEARSR